MKAASSVCAVMHKEVHKLGGKVNGCSVCGAASIDPPEVCKTGSSPDAGEQIVCESVCLLCTLHMPSPQLSVAQLVRSVGSVC